MSSKLRNCRRSLAAALDQAAEEVSDLSSSSPNNCSLITTSQDDTYVSDRGQIACVFLCDKCAAVGLIILLVTNNEGVFYK